MKKNSGMWIAAFMMAFTKDGKPHIWYGAYQGMKDGCALWEAS